MALSTERALVSIEGPETWHACMLFGLKFRQCRAMYSNTSAPTPPEFQGRARKPALGSGPNIAAYGLEFYVAGFSSAAVLCAWRGVGEALDRSST